MMTKPIITINNPIISDAWEDDKSLSLTWGEGEDEVFLNSYHYRPIGVFLTPVATEYNTVHVYMDVYISHDDYKFNICYNEVISVYFPWMQMNLLKTSDERIMKIFSIIYDLFEKYEKLMEIDDE